MYDRFNPKNCAAYDPTPDQEYDMNPVKTDHLCPECLKKGGVIYLEQRGPNLHCTECDGDFDEKDAPQGIKEVAEMYADCNRYRQEIRGVESFSRVKSDEIKKLQAEIESLKVNIEIWKRTCVHVSQDMINAKKCA